MFARDFERQQIMLHVFSPFRSFKRRPRDVTSGPDLSLLSLLGLSQLLQPQFFVNLSPQLQKVELVMQVADARTWPEIMELPGL